MLKANKAQGCEECFKIKCKKCGWEPSDIEVQEIMSGKLKKCPDCGALPS